MKTPRFQEFQFDPGLGKGTDPHGYERRRQKELPKLPKRHSRPTKFTRAVNSALRGHPNAAAIRKILKVKID